VTFDQRPEDADVGLEGSVDPPELSLPSEPERPRSPIGPGRRQRQAPRTFGPPAPPVMSGGRRRDMMSGGARRVPEGWTAGDMTILEGMVRAAHYMVPSEDLNKITQMVMTNSDPSIIQSGSAKFARQLGLSTREMFEEEAVLKLLGFVSDEDAFAQATVDRFYETGAALANTSKLFAESEEIKMTVTTHWLEAEDVRGRIAGQLAERGLVFGVGDKIEGLRGKSLKWKRDGDQLALRWFTEDPKPGEDAFVDVLIHLKPGTETNTSIDAVTEYLLAVGGVAHVVAPTSGDVPGRQNFVGALFEGADDMLNWAQKFGGGYLEETISELSTQMSTSLAAVSMNPVPEQQEADDEAVREQESIQAVTRTMRDNTAVAIARREMLENPEQAMSATWQAGLAGAAMLEQDELEAQATTILSDLDAAEKRRLEEQSFLGEFIEQDLAPPVLGALEVWIEMLYFGGIVILDATNIDAWIEIAQDISENGIDALFDPMNLQKFVSPIDLEFVIEQVRNIQEEGLPKALAAYVEATQDTTFADYYGIDPESNWAAWVNQAGLVVFDPVTWGTLGASASWNALRRSVQTVAGVERIMQSRNMLSAIKNIAVKDSVGTVMIMQEGNMGSTAIAKLFRIAGTHVDDKAAQIAQMQEIRTIMKGPGVFPANGGFYIPSPAAVMRRKTTLGISQWFKIAPSDTKARSFMQDVLIRASNSRSINISEREWLSERFRVIQVKHAGDAKAMADDAARAVETYEAYRAGDISVAMMEGRFHKLKGEIVDLDISLMPGEVKQIPKLRKQVGEWNDSVTELDRRIAGAADDATREAFETSRAQAIKNRDETQALLDVNSGEASRLYDQRVKDLAGKQREVKRIEGLVEDLGTASRDRSLLERDALKYMADWMEEWGVPVKLNLDGSTKMHPIFGDIPLFDLDDVVGPRGASPTRGVDKVSGLSPLGAEFEATFEGVPRVWAELPVSPTELLAWKTMQRNAGSRLMWKAINSPTGQIVKATMDNVQAIFASSVLLNPITATRSHFDEVIRFYENNGFSVDLLKSTFAIEGKIGPEARAFSRDVLDNFLAPNQQMWQLVKPGDRGQWVHAERWINGSLTKQELFQGYARAVVNSGGDEAAARVIWEKFWNERGVNFAKRTTVNGTPITAGNSFDIVRDGFDNWLGGFKAVEKKGRITAPEARKEILNAAANGVDVKWGPKIWRQLPEVPAQVSTQAGSKASGAFRHTMDVAFRAGYGAPQSRRGEVFYDHAYEWAKGVYDESYAGKMLNAKWLLDNGHATSMNHAQEILNQGRRSQVVRDLIAESGMVIESDLRNAAMRYAASSADDMMYTFSATSIFGKKIARVYPFGRAQLDYYQWWWKKLTQPTQFVGGQLPVLGGVKRLASVPAVGGNLRLIDRMAHLVNLNTTGERPGVGTPAGIVNHFSFLPQAFDEQILFDLSPGVTPIAGWAANLPFVPDSVRNFIQELHPQHRIFTEPYDNMGQALADTMDVLFPKGGMSIRNQVAAYTRLAAQAVAMVTLDYDPNLPVTDEQQRRITPIINAQMGGWAGGPWYFDRVKIDMIDWLKENGNKTLPDKSDDDLLLEFGFRNDEVSIASLGEQNLDFLSRVTGEVRYGGSDFSSVDGLLGVDQFVDAWFESGSISDAKRDSLLIGWELVNSGEATVDQRVGFADEVLGVLFNSGVLTDDERIEFIARNIGVHANMVSSREVNLGLIPVDVAPDIKRGRIDTEDLDRAKELYRRGDKEGWLEYRDATDVRFDMLTSRHRSVREFLDVIYKRATNGLTIDKRSQVIGEDRFSLSDLDVNLTPEWWQEHGSWLEDLGTFGLSDDLVGQLVAGDTVVMSLEEFRQVILDTKGTFGYQYEATNTLEAELNRIGIDDRPMSSIGIRLSQMPGFDDADFDNTVGLSHYGKDLAKDFNAALNLGQREFGWKGLDEWDVEWIDEEKRDDDGNIFVVRHSLEGLRSRFRVAIALSGMNATDDKSFSEENYENSLYGRNLGDLNWTHPEPPTLDKLEQDWFETDTPELLSVVDGDTIRIPTDDGPAFVRFIGLNTPEKGEDGFRESLEGLADILLQADKVQFVVWKPNEYGFRTRAFTIEEDVVVTRDRLLVWLYIDGVPLFDPEEFSRQNVRGVRTGGSVPDYQVLLDAEITRREVASRERSD